MFRKAILFLVIFLVVFLSFSLFTFHPSDSSYLVTQANLVQQNWLGQLGAFVSGGIFILFGQASYLFILLFIFIYISYFFKIPTEKRLKQLSGLLLGILVVSLFVVIITADQSFQGGGIVAGILDSLVSAAFGLVGEVFLSSSILIISILFIFDISLNKAVTFVLRASSFFKDLITGLKQTPQKSLKKPPLIQKMSRSKSQSKGETVEQVNGFVKSRLDKNIKVITKSHSLSTDEKYQHDQYELVVYERKLENEHPDTFLQKVQDNHPSKKILSNTSKPLIILVDEKEISVTKHQGDNYIVLGPEGCSTNINIDVNQKNLTETKEQVEILRNPTSENDEEKTTLMDGKESMYQYALEIFDPIQNNNDLNSSSDTNIDLNQNDKLYYTNSLEEMKTSKKLKDILKEFGIEAQVVHISKGPVITRYEVLPAPGIRVSKIVGLQDNIALSLAASKIRIVAPIPGKSAVGIEIPNKKRITLTLNDLLGNTDFKNEDYHLPIALGKDISGRTVIVDLVTMPHLLIAGSTGSGKSVFVNTLICSLLHSKNSSETRFLMIDPKRVELNMYNEIPHLITPVITEPKKAVIALKWAVNEMEVRYKLLEKYSCRDIRSYNKKIDLMKSKDPHYVVDPPLEYLVIIVDEFADLMMVCGKKVEETVSRLAAMSRAVGIHLVIATQRPSVDVITGLIKANFPARIAFQVSSKTESRIILDENGADKLLGKGDFLFSSPGLGSMLRIQGAFMSDEEVIDLTSYIKTFAPPNYIDELEDLETDDDNLSSNSIDEEPLFREAVEIILADRKASSSYLQRKMRIGYNRAARIIELLEQQGIVSPGNGSRPREILIESY